MAAVNNWGTITTATGFVGGGDLIDFQSSTGGKVNNYAGGCMEGSRHAVTGDNAVTVVNDGTMIGRNGSAVNIDNGGPEAEGVHHQPPAPWKAARPSWSNSGRRCAVDVDGLVQSPELWPHRRVSVPRYHDGEPNVSEGIAIGGGSVVNIMRMARSTGMAAHPGGQLQQLSNALGDHLRSTTRG